MHQLTRRLFPYAAALAMLLPWTAFAQGAEPTFEQTAKYIELWLQKNDAKAVQVSFDGRNFLITQELIPGRPKSRLTFRYSGINWALACLCRTNAPEAPQVGYTYSFMKGGPMRTVFTSEHITEVTDFPDHREAPRQTNTIDWGFDYKNVEREEIEKFARALEHLVKLSNQVPGSDFFDKKR